MDSVWFEVLGWFPTIAAIIGNLLVILTIVARRRLHTAPNCFVISLAVADFFVGLFYFPTLTFSQDLSRSFMYHLSVLMIYSSNANLCAMTGDRYLAIVKPLNYATWMSTKRVALLVTAAWIFPIIVDFVPALCAYFGKCDIRNKFVASVRISLLEILPCLFLLIATIRILKTAWSHARQQNLLEAQLRFNQPTYRRNKELSSTNVIVTVVAVFLICYCVDVYAFIRFIILDLDPSQELVNVLVLLLLVNSAANPIAYAFFKRDIRREFKLSIWKLRERFTNRLTPM